MSAIFETERLTVRPWTHSKSDLDRIYDTYSRWEVARWLGATPMVLQSWAEVPAVVDRWATRSDPEGRLGVWAAEICETGIVAGTVLLVTLPDDDHTGGGEVEVGWHLHPDSWGYGYATEAGRGAIVHGIAGGLTEIYAVVQPDNVKSLAVCRRLGMTSLGRSARWHGAELEVFRTLPADQGHMAVT